MGTRADFYVGRGIDAEWIGSIAWDGYPGGIADDVLDAKSDDEFRSAFEQFISDRGDATKPEMGWPWPWETSHTTDYAYAFDAGSVHASCFGSNWFDPRHEPSDEGDEREVTDDPAVFPDMASGAKPNFGARSGLLIINA